MVQSILQILSEGWRGQKKHLSPSTSQNMVARGLGKAVCNFLSNLNPMSLIQKYSLLTHLHLASVDLVFVFNTMLCNLQRIKCAGGRRKQQLWAPTRNL